MEIYITAYILIAGLFLAIDVTLLFLQKDKITLADLLCSLVFVVLWFPVMLSYVLTRLIRVLFEDKVIWIRKSE